MVSWSRKEITEDNKKRCVRPGRRRRKKKLLHLLPRLLLIKKLLLKAGDAISLLS
jgi:hypothetical protein